MFFILVREPARGTIVHEEILEPTNAAHPPDDPFWQEVEEKRTKLEAEYPGYELVEGFASSVEKFLADYPEYGPIKR